MSALPIVPPTVTSRLVDASGTEVPLRATDLRARAAAGRATVRVLQIFANTGTAPLEATYQLPLPPDAAVGGFTITVNDEVVHGVVKSRDEARADYASALFEGRTAGLLEHTRDGLFQQKVGNIPAGAEVVVEVVLDQPLAWEEGQWTWRFPTVVPPRYVDAATPDTPRIAVDVADRALPARLSLTLELEDALTGAPSSPSHILDAQGPVLSLGGQRVRLDRDVVVRWPVAAPDPGVQAAWTELGGEHFASLVLVPPVCAATSVARDLILLLDVSGSMGGVPLMQAVRIASRLVKSLGPADSLEMVAFGGRVTAWHEQPVACTPANRAAACAWLEGLRASGGTPMDEGIRRALSSLRDDAQRQVLLVTDGHIGFERRIGQMILEGLSPASRLHVLGVGSSVNRSLTRLAARVGRGLETIVAPHEDVADALTRVLTHLDQPQVVDLRIEGDATLAPKRLPDLFAGAPARIALRTSARRLRLVGRTADGTWSHDLEVPALTASQPSLARCWAREAVQDLEMERLLGGAVDASITELGVQFQIATRLTSFVAVSETATVDPSDPTRQVQVTQDQPAHMNVSALGLRPAKPAFVASPTLAGAPAPAPMARSRHAMPATEETSFFGAPSEMEADLFESEPVARSVAPKKTKRRQKSLLGRMMGALRKPRRAVIKATSTTMLGQDVGVTFAWRGGPWKLPRKLTVHLTDGSTRQLEVDASRSTRDGRHDAGATLRLVLRDGASSFDAWSKIVVAGITVELN